MTGVLAVSACFGPGSARSDALFFLYSLKYMVLTLKGDAEQLLRDIRLRHLSLENAAQLFLIKAATIAAYASAKGTSRHRFIQAGTPAGVEPAEADVTVPHADVPHQEGEVPFTVQVFPGDHVEKGGREQGVGVVVPILWREGDEVQIGRLVGALGAQERLPSAVTLVDDGSPVPLISLGCLPTLLRPLTSRGIPVQVVTLPSNQGPAAARNAGMDAAWALVQPTVLLFTDLDCLPNPDWIKGALGRLSKIDASLEGTSGGAHSGEVQALLGGPALSAGSTVFDKFHERWGTLSPRLIPERYRMSEDDACLYIPTCNMAMCGASLIRPGGLRFDTRFRTSSFEDVALSLAARCCRKIPLLFEPDMAVTHVFGYRSGALAFGTNLSSVCRQFAKYGSWEPLVNRLYPKYESWLAVSLNAPPSFKAVVPVLPKRPVATCTGITPGVGNGSVAQGRKIVLTPKRVLQLALFVLAPFTGVAF